ncbi:threonylcarbamoyl-AMP synthase [Egibacter rhizosphaerae]|uniref:L-threonylcarbamoyladenylate synthase n=1 Tax=Egibacter rhizosphaerae TaxID=1670831 RepID=A0A411YD60_9ACTN|nr:L-threonylcarbamoyladenylate synthase [Egibacter rhizosphaerae]QBI19125.1 threonylcarbamoyl-AMP synthase [Egibacter rhizosphaerae]
MSDVLPADDPATTERLTAELRAGLLVVAPAEHTYAVIADGFTPTATRRLLRARGAGRNRPVPVAIRTPYQITAVAQDVGDAARALMDAFWPGPLTLVLRAVPGLGVDLGNARGTIQVRMPSEPLLDELIAELGPLALTGAHRRGRARPSTVEEAREELGDSAAVYADGGPREGPLSTIVDARGDRVAVLREGELDTDAVRDVVGADRLVAPARAPATGEQGAADLPAPDDPPARDGATERTADPAAPDGATERTPSASEDPVADEASNAEEDER